MAVLVNKPLNLLPIPQHMARAVFGVINADMRAREAEPNVKVHRTSIAATTTSPPRIRAAGRNMSETP